MRKTMKIDSIEILDQECFVKTVDYGKTQTISKDGLRLSIKNEIKSDMPDIDFDVSDPMAIKEMMIQKYGENNVVPISNYNTLQFRSLIKDISKLYGIPFQEVNEVTGKMLKEATPKAKEAQGITAGVYNPTFEELKMYSPTLQQFFKNYPHIATHVNNLHGQIRSISRHAGGVLFADNLDEKMPLINSGGIVQTPWTEGQTVRHLEPMGFIKFDILGLASLRMIETCIKHILKRHNGMKNPSFKDIKKFYEEVLHPDKIDLKDKEVYQNVFQKGNFCGTFQFTANGAQEFCKGAKPENITDISAITSIYRPGPLSAGVAKSYVEAKNNPDGVHYAHPIIKDVLGETYGFLVFQEQLSMLAHKLGHNISLDEGNELRKVLTKKGTGKEAEVKNKLYSKFVKGCLNKGLTQESADEIWKTMEYFSGYGFNLSHAVCYSILSYQCAWLFTYYPSEWMVAFLDKEPENRKELAISIAKSYGFKIKQIDVNKSEYDWEIDPDNDKILIQPLSSAKGLGDAAIQEIIAHRPFKTVEELLYNPNVSYSKLNKKALDSLCRSGGLDDLKDARFTGMKHFWSAVVVDRPKTVKKLAENIEKYKPEGEFTNEEVIENYVSISGVYPVSMVVDSSLIARLNDKEVYGIASFIESAEYREEGDDTQVCWFIVREAIIKQTKNGKLYWQLSAVDPQGSMHTVKVWGVKKDSVIYTNRPYMAKLKMDSWGLSTFSPNNLKLLG